MSENVYGIAASRCRASNSGGEMYVNVELNNERNKRIDEARDYILRVRDICQTMPVDASPQTLAAIDALLSSLQQDRPR